MQLSSRWNGCMQVQCGQETGKSCKTLHSIIIPFESFESVFNWFFVQVDFVEQFCECKGVRIAYGEHIMMSSTGLEFFETSAKDNVNVTIVFERLVDLICDRMSKSLDANAAILNNPQTKRLTSQGGGSAPSLLASAQNNCQQCWGCRQNTFGVTTR